MRPLELKIQGFTCFSDPVEVNFRELDVFAITGPTGAGKSTLIDAICYALYGRVPRYTDTMSLISYNRDSMSVQLEFAAGDFQYRVHRGINRSAPRNGKEGKRMLSPVQLERFTEDGWQPIEDRVRAIDEEIVRIVGLDFKGFTSCVVLPQGSFQEFLAGDSKDRRKVLIDLLDISVYERIMTVANERGRRLTDEAASLDRRLREDYADATPETVLRYTSEKSQIEGDLEVARRQRDALNEAVALATSVSSARARQAEREQQQMQTLQSLESLRDLAREGQAKLAEMRQELSTASAQYEGIEYDGKLHGDLRAALSLCRNLNKLQESFVTASEKAANQENLQKLEAAAKVAAVVLQKTQTAALQAREDWREAERRDAASHLKQGLKPGDLCPVCGEVVVKIDVGSAVDLKPYERAVKLSEVEEKNAQNSTVRTQAAVASEKQRLQSEADQLERMRLQVAAAQAELIALTPAGMVPDERAITAALVEMEQTSGLREELANLISELRRQTDALAPQIARSDQELAGMAAQAGQQATEALAAASEAQKASIELVGLCTLHSWQDALVLLDAGQDCRRLLSQLHTEAQGRADGLNARNVFLEGELDRLQKAIVRAGEIRCEMEGLVERGNLHRELGRLLRADAFQSFVLEEAMTSLASTATKHLETLYSRFALTVEGGEFQVIDHWQADTMRPARTLSGGETFVGSLALALALAERIPELRHSAATTLESLFLDEGFGTLDQATLDTVIGALEGLRSQERMVGLITHVPELARRIESRIEVEKSPSGSSISVVAG